MKKFKLISLVLIACIGMSAATVNNDRLYEISKNIEIFVKVYKELNSEYVDDLDPSKLMRTGIDAMLASLDPYTNYISESQVESYRINSEGKYTGIGAIVKKIGDYVTIVEPYEGSSVLEAGIKAGDQITEVEGKSTKGKSMDDVNQIMRGVPGTSINLTIKSPGESKGRKVSLKRSEVNIPNVPYSGMVNNEIAYVALTTFTPAAGKNVANAITELKKDHDLKGVILDLRDNGGGLLREAVSLSNLFINKGLMVVSTKGKIKEREKSFKTMTEPLDLELPLVVMINKNSASASEIVSGVIQDYDRGVIIGQRSYGKGLVQNTKEVGFNSRVKLTTSKYYIPSGRCIQSVEYEDGEPKDIPDNKRSKFKTTNGRTVLDGGGITPDIKLTASENPEFIKALEKQHVVFQFIDSYLKGKTGPETMFDIEFDDYEAFKSFVVGQDFNFKTKSEQQLEQLLETADEEGLKDLMLTDIDAIKGKIKKQHQLALDQNQGLIMRQIKEQIATRYFYQKGKAFQRLDGDPEVATAISLLTDQSKYNGILSK